MERDHRIVDGGGSLDRPSGAIHGDPVLGRSSLRRLKTETGDHEAVAGGCETLARLLDWLARNERPAARRGEAS
jgi:hypothetical protein